MDKKEKENLLKQKEYQFIQKNKELRKHIILLGLSGSHSYGTNTPTSDIDIRAICKNTREEILSLHSEDTETQDDTDTVIYKLNKACNLLANCNPNMVELLGLREEDYLILTGIGKELIENQSMFYSKKAKYSFGGYATAQLRRLENALAHDAYPQEEKLKHIKGSIENTIHSFNERYKNNFNITIKIKDNELVTDMQLTDYPLQDAAGMFSEMKTIIRNYEKLNHRNRKKDDQHLNKHAMHLVRLLLTGTELLKTGKMVTYREKEHNLLMDIRNGKYQKDDHTYYKEFFELVTQLEKDFEYAADNTVLPETPDMLKIQEFIMNVNYQTIRG